jgi:hypothetical protein
MKPCGRTLPLLLLCAGCGGDPTSPWSLLARDLHDPTSIVAGDGVVYFTAIEGVYAVPSSGGTAALLAPNEPAEVAAQSAPYGFAADASSLYFVGEHIHRVAKTGGLVTDLSGTPRAVHLATGGGYVYWPEKGEDLGAGRILRQPVSDGPTSVVADGEDQPSFVLVDGDRVLWVAADFAEHVSLRILDGQGKRTLATARSGGGEVLALDPARTSVYLTTVAYDPAGTSETGTVVRVPLDGSPPVEVVHGLNPIALVVDADRLYFSTSTGLMAAPIAGGAPVRFARGIEPRALAQDGDAIYATEANAATGTGQIERIPKRF